MAALEEPLVVNAVYPDCAGCKCSHLSKKGAGPPTRQLISLGLIVLCNALPISSLYPFLYFMVRDFHVAKSEQDIGYFAGVIGSSFMIGRFFTGIYWGVLADKYGRKPVIFAGVLSVIVFNTFFGLSSGFWMAVVTRFLLGSFNGMLGTVKAYASEICSEEHQALGVSVVSTTWAFGLIIGPALGGYLSQPAKKYPNIFKSTLFDRFPYLLPCLCITIFAILALAITFDLPETLHNHEPSHEGCFNDNGSKVKSQNGDATASAAESGLATAEDPKMPSPKYEAPKTKSLWKNQALLGSTAVYCIWSMHDIAYTEIFSLWALSPTSLGGLNFRSSDVGNVFAISGINHYGIISLNQQLRETGSTRFCQWFGHEHRIPFQSYRSCGWRFSFCMVTNTNSSFFSSRRSTCLFLYKHSNNSHSFGYL
ncbi:hypothetical protein O6H91_19G056000 [Diphasiastrum complanatum]|uniref:Uncharacterized protein n=1 Tax=Diphasiastrum complanatum TaxID=34168 RepID=A0ACC2AVD5_DIPCM|nr:hypothetical protein O6H91_19G056000 [Diphasiastrum complanatum]